MENLDLKKDEVLPRQEEPEQEMHLLIEAARLLSVIWKSIDPEYKSQYRAEIWRQFEERIAAAARMTATMPAFVSRLCGMLPIASLGPDEQARAAVLETLYGHVGDTDALLRVIRAYPAICVVQVRAWNDQEKAEKAMLKSDSGGQKEKQQ